MCVVEGQDTLAECPETVREVEESTAAGRSMDINLLE